MRCDALRCDGHESTNSLPIEPVSNSSGLNDVIVDDVPDADNANLDNLDNLTEADQQVQLEDNTEVQETTGEEHEVTDSVAFKFTDIEKGNVLQFKHPSHSQLIQGRVINRAGKATGKNRFWWNIQNLEDGEAESYDTERLDCLDKVADESVPTEEAYVVVIPRWRHAESRCIRAKEKELASWKEFGTYTEVKDEGQKTLGLNWILTDKVIDGKPDIKARLCVRGDLEAHSNLRTDSPTIHKTNIKIFLLVAAAKNWVVKTADIRSAFLQGKDLDRDVFVQPPRERKVKGILWKMIKPAYGLLDASRGFFLELSHTLSELGCEQSRLDPAFYTWKINGQVQGIILTHVDDVLHGSGSEEFNSQVLVPLQKKFKFGSADEREFRYVGMNVVLEKGKIVVNQDHYLESIEMPDMDLEGPENDLMDEQGQEEFRGIVGKIGWLGGISRPDLAFDHVALSSKLGKASIGDMRAASKVIKKMKLEKTTMTFPDLGNISNWVMEGFGDAGFKSLPDQMSSCGGKVILLKNKVSGAACIVSWRSKKLKRLALSSTAAEALAATDLVSEMIYVKGILEEMMGGPLDIPVVAFTDSKNLWKACHTTALVDDPRLRIDVVVLKECIEKGELVDIKLVPGNEMIANCLTKKGASARELMRILHKGLLGRN